MSRVARIERALTSTYHSFTYLEANKCPKTVEQALGEELPHLAPSSWEARAAYGGMYLNGKSTEPGAILTTPCRIEYYEPKFSIEDAPKQFPEFNPKWILYNQQGVLVAFKPPGLPSSPSREQKTFCLRKYLEDYLGHQVHLPSRIDMSAQGILIVSTSVEMHPLMQQLFEKREIEKRYLFETTGKLRSNHVHVDSAIDRDPSHPILRRVVTSGGKSAQTDFRKVAKQDFKNSKGLSVPSELIEAHIHTGRTHQIRLHASTEGIPIIGDNFYEGTPAIELRLLSYLLKFQHPKTKDSVELKISGELAPDWAKKGLI